MTSLQQQGGAGGGHDGWVVADLLWRMDALMGQSQPLPHTHMHMHGMASPPTHTHGMASPFIHTRCMTTGTTGAPPPPNTQTQTHTNSPPQPT